MGAAMKSVKKYGMDEWEGSLISGALEIPDESVWTEETDVAEEQVI
jgi:hypothetical protein